VVPSRGFGPTAAGASVTWTAGASVTWTAGASVTWTAGALATWTAGALVTWTARALAILKSARRGARLRGCDTHTSCQCGRTDTDGEHGRAGQTLDMHSQLPFEARENHLINPDRPEGYAAKLCASFPLVRKPVGGRRWPVRHRWSQ